MKQLIINILLFFSFFILKSEIIIINNTGQYIGLAIPESGPSDQKMKRILGRESKRNLEETIEIATEFRNALKITKNISDFFIETKENGKNIFYMPEQNKLSTNIFSLEKKYSIFGSEEEEFELKPILHKKVYIKPTKLIKTEEPKEKLIYKNFPKTPLKMTFSEETISKLKTLKWNIYFQQEKHSNVTEQKISLKSENVISIVEPFKKNLGIFLFFNNNFSRTYPFEINFNELIYSDPYTIKLKQNKQQKEYILNFTITDKASINFVNLVGEDKEILKMLIEETQMKAKKINNFLEFNKIEEKFYYKYLSSENYQPFANNKLELIEKEKISALKEPETFFNSKLEKSNLKLYLWRKFIFVEKQRSFSL